MSRFDSADSYVELSEEVKAQICAEVLAECHAYFAPRRAALEAECIARIKATQGAAIEARIRAELEVEFRAKRAARSREQAARR